MENKKQRKISLTYGDMNLKSKTIVQIKAIINNNLTIGRFQNPVNCKITS